MPPTLYHYTCRHFAARIGVQGLLRVSPVTGVLWLTDLDSPVAGALGLTSTILACDRTEARFVVDDPDDTVTAWLELRRSAPRYVVEALESAPGAMPRHWWIATGPQFARRA